MDQKLDINGRPEITIGQALRCTETGKSFTAERDGMTVNYARNSKSEIFSDEGVDIRERRELLDRTKPFYCYLSADGKNVTGWKGNKLGSVVKSDTSKTGFRQTELTHVNVVDVHGNKWHGKGAGTGMAIRLRPSLSKKLTNNEERVISAMKAIGEIQSNASKLAAAIGAAPGL